MGVAFMMSSDHTFIGFWGQRAGGGRLNLWAEPRYRRFSRPQDGCPRALVSRSDMGSTRAGIRRSKGSIRREGP